MAALTRDGAAQQARDELGKRIYQQAQPSLVNRILSDIWKWISDAYNRATSATPGGALGLLIIIAVLAGLALLLIRRRRSFGRARSSQDPGLDIEPGRTADQFRADAARFAAAGEWAEAVRARLRAVVVTLEARGDIDPRPGRTAAEVASEAGAMRPELRDQLWRGALTFGEIWYGRRRATSIDDQVLQELDEAVRRRPHRAAMAGSSSAPSGYTTPR